MFVCNARFIKVVMHWDRVLSPLFIKDVHLHIGVAVQPREGRVAAAETRLADTLDGRGATRDPQHGANLPSNHKARPEQSPPR